MQFETLRKDFAKIVESLEDFEGDMSSERYRTKLYSLRLLSNNIESMYKDLKKNGMEFPALLELSEEINAAWQNY